MRHPAFLRRARLSARTRTAALVSGWLLGLLSSTVTAVELRIITSYQADVVTPVRAAFQERHPDIRVRVLNKNTHAAVDEMLAGNDRQFDLFWASAPEAFVVLERAGRLVDIGYGKHTDFAWSAVGWTWRGERSAAG